MIKKSTFLRLLSYWPPYLGAGIRVKKISADFRLVEVQMNAYFWNRNYMGTHFGGSLFAMVDPFYMLMLIENLGPDYVVWDKSATIQFKKPGRGKVRARFELSSSSLDSIRSQAQKEGRAVPEFKVQILDETGDIVAEVSKVISVRLRKPSTAEDDVKK